MFPDQVFNGRLLMLARDFRQVTQAQLIQMMDRSITQGTLSKIEHGLLTPDEKQVDAFTKALRLRENYFYQQFPLFDFSHSFYRSQKSVPVSLQKTIQAKAHIYRMHIRKLLESVDLEPELEPINRFDPEEKCPKEIAAIVRRIWDIPEGPVHYPTSIIERSGIIIIPMDFGTMKMDGFCQHAMDGVPPLIFINKHLPVDRYRFSLLHELGHLIMHKIQNDDQEKEANEFASAFLMPERNMENALYDLSFQRFMHLKQYWGVSLQALMRKAKDTGRITERNYRYYQMELSKKGFRKNEPVNLEHFRETPSTLQKLVKVHINELDYTEEELANITGLYVDELQEMYGLKPKPKIQLKLVVNQ